jgi:malate dehydrogenase
MMRTKVTIMGAGRVGSTTAQMLAYKELCDIVLWDRNAESAKGIALDILESSPLAGFDVSITGTSNFNDIKGSDIVVLTAGAPRKEGMSRDDLLKTNANIVKPIAEQIKRHAPDCILIVLTNPLDAMVYLTKKATGFPPNRVIGMAGILDSARFRTFIANELDVSVVSVSAIVLGGHGDFMVPLPSNACVSGIPIEQLLSKDAIDRIIERTRQGGAEIISLEKSSSAFYAPAASLVTMIESILKDKKEVRSCAAYLNGEYGIKGIFMGVPVVLGSNGIERIMKLKLTKNEEKDFKVSAEKVRALAKQVDSLL